MELAVPTMNEILVIWVVEALPPLLPPTNSVDEALRLPDTVKPLPMLDEALLIKPPVRTDKPLAWKVEEAFKAPATWRPAETDDEAVEIKPVRVAKPKAFRVPDALTLPEEST